MTDTVFRVRDVEAVARARALATEYAEYKVLRNRFQSSVLGQLGPAIQASTLASVDGPPYPVRFRNLGALEEWRDLSTTHGWSRRLSDDWAIPRATCLDCINELCWQVDRHLDQRVRHHPPGWPNATFATIVRWAANIHFERKHGALKRLPGVDPKKHAKLQRRLDTLYDHITIGPASAPAIARSSRNLIFVAPILIHADRFDGQPPPPKAYEITTARARNDVPVTGATTQHIQPARFTADSRQPLARAFQDRT